jgi:cyclopropane fatty-acyl-phospholipid synthase-like methyltransferase
MKFDDNYLKENMMGPNAVTILEELTSDIELTPDMRIMDLSCGRGLTSMMLADKTKAQVIAVDLWITATDNFERFREKGFDKNIIPIHADVMDLPFAHEYFDAVICIDAYHYFGRNAQFMDEKLAPFVKKGGLIALAIPGLIKDIHGNIPQEMLQSWSEQDLETIQTSGWWEEIFKESKLLENVKISQMSCYESSWADWLKSDNEYAVSDRAAMEAGAGKYMNFISVLGRRKP